MDNMVRMKKQSMSGESGKNPNEDATMGPGLVHVHAVEQESIQMNFFQILPEEMRELIFEKLNDPMDIITCSKVCSDWNMLLEKKKTSAYFQLILPHLLPYLHKYDLENCTKVSKDWNKCLDTCFLKMMENKTYQYKKYAIPDLYFEGSKHLEPFLLKTTKHVNENCSTMSCLWDNPPSPSYRRVTFSDHCVPDDELDNRLVVYGQFILEFLRKFGSYIYELELILVCMKPQLMVKLLVNCLSYVPNMQSLVYVLSTNDWDDADTHEVEDLLAVTAFPKTNLKRLMAPGHHLPRELISLILENYGNQLVDVEIRTFPGVVEISSLLSKGVTFENLKNLKIVFGDDIYTDESLVNINRLIYFLSSRFWKLEELNLQIDNGGNRENYSLLDLFRVLKNQKPDSVNIPKLKRLTLNQFSVPPIQLLQRAAPALEQLDIYIEDELREFLMPDSLNMKRLWRKLPKLKVVRFGSSETDYSNYYR